MTPEDRERCVAEFLERRETGESIDVESFLEQRAPGDSPLRKALLAALRTEMALPAPFAGDMARLGHYQVIRALGQGSSGRVLEARDTRKDGPHVALKLLHPALAFDARARERFHRECQSLGLIRHDGVVTLLEEGEEGAVPFMVLELMIGESLDSLIPRKPLEREEEVRAVVQCLAHLARAVAAVNAQGFVHRDIKPANVVLRKDGRPVLIDFGLVGVPSSATLTGTGDVLGTPQYMAPEQARGEEVDARADVFSLGTLLWHLLTGAAPHGSAKSLEALERARRSEIPLLRSIAPSMPLDLERILYRATAFDAARRTLTALQLAEDLERFLEGRSILARGTTWVERLQRLRRRRPMAAAALLAATAVSLIAATAWWRHESSRPSSAEVLSSAREITDRLHRALASSLDGNSAQASALLSEIPKSSEGLALYQWWINGPIASGVAALRTDSDPALALVESLRLAELRKDWSSFDSALTRLEDLLPECGWLHLQRGRSARERGDHVAAARELSSATAVFSEDAGLWRDLALSANEIDDVTLAMNAAQQAVRCAREQEADATIERLLLLHGMLLDRHGEYMGAEPLFREILHRRPEMLSAHFHLAMNLDWQHRMREAADEYLRTLEYDPLHVRALAALAWLYSGSNWECEDCKSAFAREPSLRDDVLAEEYALRAAAEDGGRDRGVIFTAAQVLRRIGAAAKGREKLQELLDAAESDEQIVHLQRALRMLQR